MELKKVFEERRSVNFFDPNKALGDDLLKEIIDLAVTAPSAFNLQPWEIVAVASEEAKKKLFDLSGNQPKVLDAPVTLIVIGDRSGYTADNPAWKELADMMGDEKVVDGYIQYASMLYGSTDERKIKFAESNAGLLAMAIMLAAEDLGVAAHPMSGIDFGGIKKAFDIEGNKEVVMTISLGYFDESKQLYPRRVRKGYDEIVRKV